MSQNNIERKRGNRLGFWFFRTAVRLSGLRGAYGLLYCVSLYYLIFDRAAVASCMAYARRRFPEHSSPRRVFDVYLLFVSQGKNLIDRYYVAAGGDDIAVEIRGFEALQKLLADGNKGFILLTAHVGNWQVAMQSLKKFERDVYLMMRPEDNAAVKEALNIDSEGEKVRILYTDGSLGGVIDAMRVINRGCLVSIMGDRTYHFSSEEAELMGGMVRFPYGAFSIASAVQCPVIVLLSARIGLKQYLVDVSQIIEPPAGERGRKEMEMKTSVQKFARILEAYAAIHPYQWFVFRDIWKSNE